MRQKEKVTCVEVFYSNEDEAATIKDYKRRKFERRVGCARSKDEENKIKKKETRNTEKEHVASAYKEYKYELGVQARKEFDAGWHVGTIVDTGAEGVVNAYEVSYVDGDLERLEEWEIDKIVMDRRESL